MGATYPITARNNRNNAVGSGTLRNAPTGTHLP